MSTEGAYALVLGVFAQQLLDGRPLTIRGDGEQRRDFIYVKDVARANILASTSPSVGAGEIINIGSGTNQSVNEVAELMGGATINTPAVIEPQLTLCDNSRAKELLGEWDSTMTLEKWVPLYKKSLGLCE